MPKITLVGAGSHVFAQRLITDALTWPSLQNGTITLMDIDEKKLRLMTALARKIVNQLGVSARIEATTELEAALDGADYVVVSIRASSSRHHITVPAKYGISQAIGDTMGPGGAFYFLKNAPAMMNIAKTMERVCPDALMLNYTNPMVMLSWAITQETNIRYVGLCHSVQGTAQNLADYIGKPIEEISFWAAGINHMAWFLKYQWKGQDAYPLILKAMEDPDIYARDIVKFEILKHFGAFVTESSIHNSEYMPYFRRTPELIARHTSESMWGVTPGDNSLEARWTAIMARRAEQDRAFEALALGNEPIEIERSHEYCTRILNAIETNAPYVFNGNVANTSLITNLVHDCVVEVPILVDGCGLHPCHVGDLPPALAALNRTNLNLQGLVVKGFLEGDRECIYRAIQLDPLTASVLPLADIRAMVAEMFEADADDITI